MEFCDAPNCVANKLNNVCSEVVCEALDKVIFSINIFRIIVVVQNVVLGKLLKRLIPQMQQQLALQKFAVNTIRLSVTRKSTHNSVHLTVKSVTNVMTPLPLSNHLQ